MTLSPRDSVTVNGETQTVPENGQISVRRDATVTMDGSVVKAAQLTLNWLKDGELIEQGDTVSITSTTEGMSTRSRLSLTGELMPGRYTFSASTDVGTVSDYVILNVLGRCISY